MGYYIDIITDHAVLVDRFASDGSVNKSLFQETLDNDNVTFVFPSKVCTFTSKFFNKFFYTELSGYKSKDDFLNKYKFIFTHPNDDLNKLVDTYVESYYLVE